MFRSRNKCQILESSFNSALGNEVFQFGVIRQVNLFLSLFHLENSWLNKFFAELGLLVLGIWRRIDLEEVLKRMVDGVFEDLLPLVDLNVTRCGVVVADRWVRLESHKLLKNWEVLAFNKRDLDLGIYWSIVLNRDSVLVFILDPFVLNRFELVLCPQAYQVAQFQRLFLWQVLSKDHIPVICEHIYHQQNLCQMLSNSQNEILGLYEFCLHLFWVCFFRLFEWLTVQFLELFAQLEENSRLPSFLVARGLGDCAWQLVLVLALLLKLFGWFWRLLEIELLKSITVTHVPAERHLVLQF